MVKKRIFIVLVIAFIIALLEALSFILVPQFGKSILKLPYKACNYDTEQKRYIYTYGNNNEIVIAADYKWNSKHYTVILPRNNETIIIEGSKIIDTKQNIVTDTEHYNKDLGPEKSILLFEIMKSNKGLSVIQFIFIILLFFILNGAFLLVIFFPEKVIKHRSFINGQKDVERQGIILYQFISGICILGILIFCLK